MSEYTPATEDVRNHYAYGCGPEHTWAESREDFDRWLAAHDAEVRESAALIADRCATAPGRSKASIESISARDVAARIRTSVVAEEPDWEYGTESRFEQGGVPFSELEWESREQAELVASERNAAERDEGDAARLVYAVVKRIRGLKAGPWMPVEQGDDGA